MTRHLPSETGAAPRRVAACPAGALTVRAGAMAGDPIGDVAEVTAGDVYVLDPAAPMRALLLAEDGAGLVVAPGSELGVHGAPVRSLADHRLMSERGVAVELRVLALGEARVAVPSGALTAGEEYVLIASAPAGDALPSATAVSFARGTRIALPDGMLRPVEELVEGDRILTRDHGPQPLRWIGRQVVRAEGAAAHVAIAAGALGNEGPLVLAPDHRLFLYRRDARLGAAELLVRARDLVDGARVTWRGGGHLELFHLLLDAHEVIYAEGIPTESLLVSPEVLSALGEDLAEDVARRGTGLAAVPHVGLEPTPVQIDALGLKHFGEG